MLKALAATPDGFMRPFDCQRCDSVIQLQIPGLCQVSNSHFALWCSSVLPILFTFVAFSTEKILKTGVG